MSEKKKETLAKEQMRTKPKLEEFLASRAADMDNEAKQIVSIFLDYCNTKKITYRWSATNRWNLYAKGKSLGYIAIDENYQWQILLNHRELVQYEDFIQKENLSEMIYNNLHFCEGCDGNGTCTSCAMKLRFKNPGSETVESVQKILDYLLALPKGTAKRPFYDPATDGLTRIDNKQRVIRVSDLQGSNLNFDGKYNGYFYVGPYESFMAKGGSNDIVFKLDEPAELKMYSLVTGLRFNVPDKWTLYGAESEDGSWTLLDARDAFPKPVTLHTEKAFKIDAPGVYQYYRITLEGLNFVLTQLYFYI